MDAVLLKRQWNRALGARQPFGDAAQRSKLFDGAQLVFDIVFSQPKSLAKRLDLGFLRGAEAVVREEMPDDARVELAFDGVDVLGSESRCVACVAEKFRDCGCVGDAAARQLFECDAQQDAARGRRPDFVCEIERLPLAAKSGQTIFSSVDQQMVERLAVPGELLLIARLGGFALGALALLALPDRPPLLCRHQDRDGDADRAEDDLEPPLRTFPHENRDAEEHDQRAESHERDPEVAAGRAARFQR